MELVKKQKISASMLGSDGELSKIGAFQIVEDATTELMGELKIDAMTVKKKYNALWVFAKTRVKFFEHVLWNEELTVSSFISSISAVRTSVDVEVKNEQDNLVFYARVELCALDVESQRIIKVSAVGVENSMLTKQAKIDMPFAKFEIEDLPLFEQVKVKSTNIDFCHHTNNLEYIRFIVGTYSVKELETKKVKEMEVVYINQSFEGDTLDIFKCNFDDRDIIAIKNGDKPVVKCEIVY